MGRVPIWFLSVGTNLGECCPKKDHEKLILPYFSGSRGVAILDCDPHSKAGSTRGVLKVSSGKDFEIQSLKVRHSFSIERDKIKTLSQKSKEIPSLSGVVCECG